MFGSFLSLLVIPCSLRFRRLPYRDIGEDATSTDGAHARDEEGHRHLKDRVVPFLVPNVFLVPVSVQVIAIGVWIGVRIGGRRDCYYGTSTGERIVSATATVEHVSLVFLNVGRFQASWRHIG